MGLEVEKVVDVEAAIVNCVEEMVVMCEVGLDW
jgi:hypothetical protein